MAASKSQTQISILNKVSTQSVEKHTGRNWDQWIVILNKAGGQALTHKELVAFLVKKYKLSLWWRQIVASSYEIHIGRKIEGQNSKGLYASSTTKTFPLSQKKMWELLNSEEGMNVWLKPMSPFQLKKGLSFEVEGGIFGEVRTVVAPMKARIRWQDSDWDRHTVLQVYVLKRPKDKCLLAFQHDEIPNVRVKAQIKQRWVQAMEDLKEYVDRK